MAEHTRRGTCANPECARENVNILGRGWCSACYNRWCYWGKPDSGPPSPTRDVTDSAACLEDYDFLVSVGVTDIDELARRVGVTKSTIYKYGQMRREAAQ